MLGHCVSLDYKSIWFILFPKLRMIYSVLIFGSVIHQCSSSCLTVLSFFKNFVYVVILFEVYVPLEHHSFNLLIFVALPFEIRGVTYFSETVNKRAALPCSLMVFSFILIKICFMNLFSSGQQLSSPS